MTDKNLLLQDDAFAPAAPVSIDCLPSHHCAENPDCGACPGDGSICASSCRVAEESPQFAAINIRELLREHLTMSMFINAETMYAEMNSQRAKAADLIALLESEATRNGTAQFYKDEAAAGNKRIAELEKSLAVALASEALFEKDAEQAQIAAQAGQPPTNNIHVASGCEQFTHWTIAAPDGRQWTGGTGMKALAASRKDTVDPVAAMRNIKAAIDEQSALDNAHDLAIVQAALDAAASKCEDLHLGDDTNSDWHCGVSDCAMFIRAINPQSILDGMNK